MCACAGSRELVVSGWWLIEIAPAWWSREGGSFLLYRFAARFQLQLAAFVARRNAEQVAVALAEMRRGNEAAGERDVDDGLAGLQQQQACAIQAQVQVIARRHAVQVLLEQPFQLAS